MKKLMIIAVIILLSLNISLAQREVNQRILLIGYEASSFLLLSTSDLAQAEKPLHKLSVKTLRGEVLEFFSKPEELLDEPFEFDKDSILNIIRKEKNLQAAQQLQITAFIKPEKEFEEPLDPAVVARFAQSEEAREVK